MSHELQRGLLPRTAPLNLIKIQRMLTIFLRNEDAFRRAMAQLQPDQFKGPDRYLGVIWAVVCDHWSRYSVLPTAGDVLNECGSRLHDQPGVLTEPEVRALRDFIRVAYRIDATTLNPQVGLAYLKRFLEEEIVEEARSQLSEVAVPADVFGFLHQMTERTARLSTLTDPGIQDPFTDDWDTEGRKTTPLGIGPLDHFLGGGYANGELYVILGPIGSCKTLTAIQISTNIAEIERLKWREQGPDAPLGLSYFFYYELSDDEVKQRAITYRAKIHKDIILAGNLRNSLKKPGEQYREYERELFSHQFRCGEKVDSEFERFQFAKLDLNTNWRAIAMKPTTESPGRGGGSFDEIAQLIADDLGRQRANGKNVYCASVVADYAGVMIERMIQVKDLDRDKNYRPHLVRLPLHMKAHIAERFNCPVFLMHQLNAKGNAVVPTVLPKTTDSEGSNMIVENSDFGLIIGKPALDYLCLMGCGKARQTAIKKEVVFQIRGEYGYITFPSTPKIVDATSRQFVDARQVHGVHKKEKPRFSRANQDVYDT